MRPFSRPMRGQMCPHSAVALGSSHRMPSCLRMARTSARPSPLRRGGTMGVSAPRPRATPGKTSGGPSSEQVFLSDLIAFESDIEKPSSASSGDPTAADPTVKVQEIIDRATKVLEAARQALGSETAEGGAVMTEAPPTPAAAAPSTSPTAAPAAPSLGAAPDTGSSVVGRVSQPPVLSGGSSSGPVGGASEQLTRRWGPMSDEQDLTRHVLQNALDQKARSGGGGGGSAAAAPRSAPTRPTAGDSGDGSSGGAAPPSWAASFLSSPSDFGSSSSEGGGLEIFGSGLRLQTAPTTPKPPMLTFAEPEPPPAPTAALLLASQEEEDMRRARSAVLPPLQSIMELTSAFRPPERGAAAPSEDAATAEPSLAGRALADGSGALPDGSTWEKKSGVEYGQNGYWKRWHLLRGTADGGRVQWEETWWEASDWTGFKELGAEKKGNDAAGGAWRESWTERLHYAGADLDCVVERNAHKWAASPGGDEWEEKWGEYYHAGGKVDKWADKWGMQGPNVWHERWGEDYDGAGAVVKWTDKWAERLLPGGAREQWGDKWHEAFADGRGEKNGEVWSVDGGGGRYQRWWGEQHPGDGTVRRYGNSTTGEQWDERVAMDTYYNPVPHFGYRLALEHSPQLRNVPLRPKEVDEEDPFGPGIDAL